MANYTCTCRTNYFRVTDEERYAELYSKLCDNVQDFTMRGSDGSILHGFGSYGDIRYEDPETEEYEPLADTFMAELQEILPEDEVFMLFESGHEKLRYVVGFATVVTRHEIRCKDITGWAISQAKEMLGNPDFKTQVDY